MGCLRLLLAIAVINNHLPDRIKMLSGDEAVRLFFIISGFYMTLILTKKYHSAWMFYSNRFLRLYPSYAVIVIASIGWFCFDWLYIGHRPPPEWFQEANADMRWWQWLGLQFSNVTMIGLDIPSLFHWRDGFLFLYGPADKTPDGAEWMGWYPWIRQSWSIGAEIWFYLLAPALVRWSTLALIAIAAVSCSIMVMVHSPLIYYLFLANLWLFIIGVLLFRWYQTWDQIPNALGILTLAYVFVACLLTSTIANSMVHTAILGSVALSVPILFKSFANKKWDVFVGELSYPVYLVHLLVISILSAVLHVHSFISATLASIVVGGLMVRYIEIPMDGFRQDRINVRPMRLKVAADT
jgi:peptidoglycan/LPS O-acetylase OafA/YrhL